ncbi:MAG: DUF835 domain-containing protein [Methanomassiliicoccales archaeon]|nr:MAG: DUF835 domain-containing protein [Methanomassiliicoccales archaeon]
MRKRFIALTTIFVFLCSIIVQFPLYGEAAEPSIPSDQGSGAFTTTWTFNNASYFNTTETTIANSEVSLKTHDFIWNQSTKSEFDEGSKNNVTLTQIPNTVVVWDDGFEYSGKGPWETGIVSGTNDQWEHGLVSNIPGFIGTHDSGIYVWGTNLKGKYADSGGESSNYYLKSPSIDLSTSERTEMSFWHYYLFDNDTNTNDGGIIEVSTDNGKNWEQIWPKAGYGSHIEDDKNPLHPTDCFGGNSTRWIQSQFDLSKYDGNKNFTFRFRFATNGQESDYGWYVDDVEITSTTFSDGEVELDSRGITGGNDPSNVEQGNTNYTIIDANNPINSDGALTEWTVFTSTDGEGKMKVFRWIEDNEEFLFVGETLPEEVKTGEVNTFECYIEVEAGDYIGWYSENAQIWKDTGGTAFVNTTHDIKWPSPNSSWTKTDFTYSISAKGTFVNREGNLISRVYDAESPAIWDEIHWGEDESILDVEISLQTRSGNSSDTSDSSWSLWSSPFSNPNGSNKINSPYARYIQFKATLTTEKQPYTPTLYNVSISYRKYSADGGVVINDFIPGARVAQWLDFSPSVNLNGQTIDYYYSLDSGETWSGIPNNGGMSSVSVLEGRIRFKMNLSTEDTTVTPVIAEITLTYSTATPEMELFIEADKINVNPGDMIYFEIFYRNKGIGSAKDVSIAFSLDSNLTYKGDNSGAPSTIETESIRKWHFEVVEPANRSFIVDTQVKSLNEETELSIYAIMNYTDVGGNVYEGVISNTIIIKVTPAMDILFIISLIAIIAAIIIILVVIIIQRIRAGEEVEERISVEDVERGIGYLVMEDNPKKSYGLFSDLIDLGNTGLCITRAFPGRVKLNYSFEGVSIIWLSRAREKDTILPTNLGAVLRSAQDFMEENERAVILLDGLEYLMVHNDFQKVLKLVHGLNEMVAINDAVLVMPFNPLTMEKGKVALLKRDLKILG